MPKRRSDHATVELAVDLAILTVREEQLQVLIIERDNEPFQGWPAGSGSTSWPRS